MRWNDAARTCDYHLHSIHRNGRVASPCGNAYVQRKSHFRRRRDRQRHAIAKRVIRRLLHRDVDTPSRWPAPGWEHMPQAPTRRQPRPSTAMPRISASPDADSPCSIRNSVPSRRGSTPARWCPSRAALSSTAPDSAADRTGATRDRLIVRRAADCRRSSPAGRPTPRHRARRDRVLTRTSPPLPRTAPVPCEGLRPAKCSSALNMPFGSPWFSSRARIMRAVAARSAGSWESNCQSAAVFIPMALFTPCESCLACSRATCRGMGNGRTCSPSRTLAL